MRPEILNSLFSSLTTLEGIGPKLNQTLSRLLKGSEQNGPAHVGDLLFHMPFSIIDRRNQPGIAAAMEGSIVTLKVRVDRHQPSPRGQSRVPYRVFVHDETGELGLVFFRGNGAWLEKQLPVGDVRYVSGKVEWFNGRPTMVHPDHIVAEEDFADLPLVEPVYPSTAGLSQKVLQRSVKTALSNLPELPEWQSKAVLDKNGWLPFASSLERIHNPRTELDIDPASPAWKRLAYDELLAGQTALSLVRARMKKTAGRKIGPTGALSEKVRKALPFQLTTSQTQSIQEIETDLASGERMLRLLQGDVGSGKTLVALMTMLAAVENGLQAGIMAPTEILARQHMATIQPLCAAVGVRVDILTGREKGKAREAIHDGLRSGDIDILIGTHALFQADVAFKDLGVVVVDEQHRFGVHQRLALAGKGDGTHVLVMTATPIPRTLVLTYFGDMDVSMLREKPAGRQPITTNAMSIERLGEIVDRMKTAISDGQKIYWICPLVEESEDVPATAAEDRFESLKKVFGEQVDLVHGRMKASEKDAAMQAFKQGQTRLLVATTVIEVGVDVPDATIMVIEHAERFGLAQLHQLRGRVGRGEKASVCLLVYKAPLGEVAKARIKIMRETEDGFLIAEEDLKLRGAGEVLGTRQSGTPGFSVARMDVHGELLEMARDESRMILNADPELTGERAAAIRTLLYLFGRDGAVRLLRAG